MKDETIGIPALYFEVGVLDKRNGCSNERIFESEIPFEINDFKKQFFDYWTNSYVFNLIPFKKIDGLTFRDVFKYKGFPNAFILRASMDTAYSGCGYDTCFTKFALFPVRVEEEDADKEISSFFEEKFSYLITDEKTAGVEINEEYDKKRRAFLTFLKRYRYSTEELIEKYPRVAEMYPDVAKKVKIRAKIKNGDGKNFSSFEYFLHQMQDK